MIFCTVQVVCACYSSVTLKCIQVTTQITEQDSKNAKPEFHEHSTELHAELGQGGELVYNVMDTYFTLPPCTIMCAKSFNSTKNCELFWL